MEGARAGQMKPERISKQRVSIRSLQIFECVARTGSTVKAAEELSVTQSAISHQMKQLSLTLGETLLERSGRTLRLTQRGAELASELTKAFLNIGDSVDTIIGRNRDRVRLAVCSSFGPGWLAPRLLGFCSQHPDVVLDLLQFGEDPDLTDTLADAFVTARPVVSGFHAVELLEERLVAVAAPRPHGRKLEFSLKPLISSTASDPMRGSDWLNYFAYAGMVPEAWHNGQWLYCSHYSMALSLAEEGAGIALVPDFLASRALQAGRLEQLGPQRLATGRTYRFCLKSARVHERPLATVMNWMAGEIRKNSRLAAAQ